MEEYDIKGHRTIWNGWLEKGQFWISLQFFCAFLAKTEIIAKWKNILFSCGSRGVPKDRSLKSFSIAAADG